MSDKPWKKHERAAAKVIGSLRKPGSGSQGRADETRSDSKHPRLYLEVKTRAKSVIRTLVNDTRKLAAKEGKAAVVVTRETGKPGAVWSVHEADLKAVCLEVLAANYTPELVNELLAAVKAHQGIEPEDF